MAEDADDDDLEPKRPLLPADDRVWRHPSELRFAGGPEAPRSERAATAPAGATNLDDRSSWGMVLAAGVSATVLFAAMVVMLSRPSSSGVSLASSTPTLISSPVAGAASSVVVEHQEGESVVRAGALVAAPGVLVTAASVIDGGAVHVVINGSEPVLGTVVGADDQSGVAVVRVQAPTPAPAQMGSALDLTAGSVVDVASAGAHAQAVVDAIGTAAGHEAGMLRLQGAVPLGAVLELAGRAVGLVVRSDASSSLAAPIEIAERAMHELSANGTTTRAWFGLSGADDERGGVRITEVVPGGPAADAGLRAGDRVTTIDGRTVRTVDQLVLLAWSTSVGTSIAVGYERDGHTDRAAIVARAPQRTVSTTVAPDVVSR